MIGKVYLSVINYYDSKTQATRKKTRPVLIVGGPYNNDYTILPISTITKRENVNQFYDILILPEDRQILHLSRECFVRTHKQTPLHAGSLIKEIGDMKTNLPDLYLDVLDKMSEFQQTLLNYTI